MQRRLAECEAALQAANSEQLRLAEVQRLTHERLTLVARATDDALYDWDLRSGIVWSNEAYVRQFGDHSSDVQVDIQAWAQRLHPDERERVWADLTAAISGIGDIWTAEYHYQRAEGDYAYILDRMHIVRDGAGKAVRMTGAMLDLTQRRQTEEALRASEEKFAQAFGLSPIMLTITSLADGRLIDVNQSLLDAVGQTREAVLGRTPVEMGWWMRPVDHEQGTTVIVRVPLERVPLERVPLEKGPLDVSAGGKEDIGLIS